MTHLSGRRISEDLQIIHQTGVEVVLELLTNTLDLSLTFHQLGMRFEVKTADTSVWPEGDVGESMPEHIPIGVRKQCEHVLADCYSRALDAIRTLT